MILKYILTFLFIFPAQANYFDFFGTSPSTSSLGNQANFDHEDPANGFYAPALLASNKRVIFSTNIGVVQTDFLPISGIVIKNDTNQDDTLPEEIGNANTDYEEYTNFTFHAALPIRDYGSLVFNLAMPIARILEANSGDPFLPEYVMYRSRYRRTNAYLSFAGMINETLSYSLGTILGFQVGADVRTNIVLAGANQGSAASAKSEAKPTLAAIVSVAQQFEKSQIYFSYRQEMKNNLEANTFGLINISGTTYSAIEVIIKSQMYYDPHTFILGLDHKFSFFDLLTSIEYQIWSGYKTPTIRFIKKGGVIKSSSDYENVETKDVMIPKLGLKLFPKDPLSVSFGLMYRPTPLKGDFSGNGNNIDSDSFTLASGLEYKRKIFGIQTTLSSAFQYQKLEERTVKKSPGLENGGSGNKVGSSNYKIGGNIMSLSLGLLVKF